MYLLFIGIAFNSKPYKGCCQAISKIELILLLFLTSEESGYIWNVVSSCIIHCVQIYFSKTTLPWTILVTRNTSTCFRGQTRVTDRAKSKWQEPVPTPVHCCHKGMLVCALAKSLVMGRDSDRKTPMSNVSVFKC